MFMSSILKEGFAIIYANIPVLKKIIQKFIFYGFGSTKSIRMNYVEDVITFIISLIFSTKLYY